MNDGWLEPSQSPHTDTSCTEDFVLGRFSMKYSVGVANVNILNNKMIWDKVQSATTLASVGLLNTLGVHFI